MAFLDDLSRKLTMVGQEAANQTKAFAEGARINARISDEERQINAFMFQLGKEYFEANKDNPNDPYINIINNIKDAYHRIDVYKEDVRRAKGMRACPNCGRDVAMNALFCSACGSQIPAAPLSDYSRKCSVCGADIPDGSSFCSKCGAQAAVNVIGVSGGVEGLGSVSQDGAYSTPLASNDSMTQSFEPQQNQPAMLQKESAAPVYSAIPTAIFPTEKQPNKTVSLEKKD